MTGVRRRGVWAIMLAITIHGVGFVTGYFIWRWANGRQTESFPMYLAILSPAMAATLLAPRAAGRVRRGASQS